MVIFGGIIVRKFMFKIFYPTQELQKILEFKSEFLREYSIINLNILLIIMLILQISESVLLILPEHAFAYHASIRFFLVVNTVLVVVLFLVKRDYSRYSSRFLNVLQITIVCNTLFLASNLNLSALGITDYIHPFIIGLTFIATALQFSSSTLTTIIFTTGFFNLVCMSILQGNSEVNFVTTSNVLIFILIAWFLGIMASRIRVQSWLNSREIIKQNEILEDLTKRDSMTRFYNHESIISHLEQEIVVTRNSGNPLCVLILDVDDFKKINDTLGHLKGDEVILMIAKHINLSVRISDLIGRYGGEEFFLIFPNTDLDYAKIISERIRTSIQQAGIAAGVTVTVSGGLAQYSFGNSDDIIRLTDQRLYSAKRYGKNQIVSQ